jgi:3-dehydroquinate synthase
MSRDQLDNGTSKTLQPSFVLTYQSVVRSEVFAGRGLLERIGELLRTLPGGCPKRVVVGTDDTVFGIFGSALVQKLRGEGFDSVAVRIPAGEQEKTFANVGSALGRLALQGIDRHDVLLALGGGVPGDLFGFVAASYMRGVRLVQVPTTVVSQVDSSIGGKVGVDLPEGKNLVGVFKHAERVLIDPDLLKTLPDGEFVAGTAEVVKHGVIADANLFDWLEAHADVWRSRTADAGPILAQAIQVKVRIVQEDERESGVRMHLNYGHTLGHALETEAGYRGLRHGEAVAWGMAMEARMAAALGLSDSTFVQRQDRVLKALGLLQPLPVLSGDAVFGRLMLDKKIKAGRIRWILPGHLPGTVVVRDDVSPDLARELIDATVSGSLV